MSREGCDGLCLASFALESRLCGDEGSASSRGVSFTTFGVLVLRVVLDITVGIQMLNIISTMMEHDVIVERCCIHSFGAGPPANNTMDLWGYIRGDAMSVRTAPQCLSPRHAPMLAWFARGIAAPAV